MTAITLLGGPPGSGKSSLARVLCARFERAVHLEADRFLGAIKSGYILPWLPDAQAQNETAALSAARAAAPFVESGYEVFLDAYIRPWSLQIYRRELAAAEMHFVVLMPTVEATIRRGLTRTDTHGVPPHVYTASYEEFTADGFEQHRVDSSELSVEETADLVLREREAGRFRIEL